MTYCYEKQTFSALCWLPKYEQNEKDKIKWWQLTFFFSIWKHPLYFCSEGWLGTQNRHFYDIASHKGSRTLRFLGDFWVCIIAFGSVSSIWRVFQQAEKRGRPWMREKLKLCVKIRHCLIMRFLPNRFLSGSPWRSHKVTHPLKPFFFWPSTNLCFDLIIKVQH